MSISHNKYFETHDGYWKDKKVPADAHARGVETRKRNGSYQRTKEQIQKQKDTIKLKQISG